MAGPVDGDICPVPAQSSLAGLSAMMVALAIFVSVGAGCLGLAGGL